MRSVLFLSLAAALLSGCGLQPLYGGGSANPTVAALRTIAVDPMPNRSGWLMRNALFDRLGNGEGAASYRLHVELDDNLSRFGIRSDRAATRERRTLRARYQLIDSATGTTVLDATAGSDAGLDVVSSEYATVAAEQTALENLTQVVADQIVARLSLFTARTGGAGRR
ncbi:hypothetical protein HMF7854_02090 [Sphingomonas ginkgonis]|uniref:Secreted (Periplasmic)-like protein n=1 Tax=Sphingomonas ginkgonis TaxID=2315330 RepID=A0A429V724_9SPHN|nr:LPS assembly lipoprotein LptE [Sphingomonas ginkgonis]RST29748.1 hypothetical protein HMF7854_02090 [Sphingomonas ginkgonis]